MRKMGLGTVGLTLSLAMSTMPLAFAEDALNYVGASVGQTDFNNSNLSNINPNSKDEKATGWKLFLGFPLSQTFSLEAGYMDLGEQTASAGATTAKANANVYNVAGVARFPVTDRISIFGKFGGYRWGMHSRTGETTANDDGFNLTYGLGGQFSVNKDIGVRVEWEQFRNLGYNLTTGKSNVNFLSVGLVYNFKFF